MGFWDRISRRLDELSEELLPSELVAVVERARKLLRDGDAQGAKEGLAQALREKPNHATALYLLGVARLRLGEAGAAKDAFAQAVALRAGFAEALVGLGQACLLGKELESAESAFQQALEQSGQGESDMLAEAYLGLGQVHLGRGRPDKAARELRKALAEDPADAEAACALLEALRADPSARAEEARAPLERQAKLDPVAPSVWMALAHLDLSAGNPDRAETAFSRVLEVPDEPPRRALALAGLAEAYLRSGKARLAHEQIMQALALAPLRGELHALLAHIHRSVRDTEAALLAYDTALALGADVLEDALECALADGACARAGAYAERILAVRATHVRALVARGLAQASSGEPVLARCTLEQVLKSTSDLRAELALAELDRAEGALTKARDRAVAVLRRAPSLRSARDLLLALHVGELGGGTPAGDLLALATRLHSLTLLRPELVDLAVPVASALEAYDQPLVVTVMGEFSSGKSTFVNALLGADVAPVGVTPTTQTIHVLKYGRERAGRIVYADDRTRDLAWDDVPRVLMSLTAQEATTIRRVEVLYPAEVLSRVNIVDTPGLNSILPEHEAAARRFLAQADAIVWLFSLGQAGKASEREALLALRREGKRVLGVINKTDLAPPSEVTAVMAHVKTSLDGLVEALLPVSAKRALAAQREGDPAALVDSGWTTVEAELEARFFREARALKRSAFVRRLESLLAEIRARATAAADRARTQRDTLFTAARGVRAEKKALVENVLPDERRRLAERVASTYRTAAHEVLALVRPRKTPFGTHSATAADRDYLVGWLERDLLAAIHPTRERVARALGASAENARRAVPGAAEGSEDIAPQSSDAVALVQARVFDRFAAYLRGFLRGGHVDEFFARVLPRLELHEDAVIHALWRHAPDVEAELLLPLCTQVEAALEAMALRLEHLAQAADVLLVLVEEGLLPALDAYDAECKVLASV